MADNYTRAGQVFRAEDVSSVWFPVVLAGSHVRVYKGVESVTVTDASVHNLNVAAGATHAAIYLEGTDASGAVRYWHGSTDPSGTVGILLKDHELIESANPSTFSAIEATGTNGGTLRVEYYAYE